MLVSERYTEVVEVLADLAPITANGTVGAHVTGYVDFADFHRGFVWMHVGTPAAASTLTVTMQQAQDTAGTGTKEFTAFSGVAGSKAPVVLVAADAGVFLGIEIESTELDASNGFHCLQTTVAVGVDSYTYALAMLGTVPRYAPTDVTNFAEIVA